MPSASPNQWNKSQKDFYDQRAHKRMWYDKTSAFVNFMIERIISFSDLQPQSRILEIGCGAGRYTIPLLQKGYHITGLDLSARFLEKLEADIRFADISAAAYELCCADVETFTAKTEKKFDAVIGFNVLHHLFDYAQTFKTIRSCLSPSGMVVFLEPHGWYPLHYLDVLLDRAWSVEGSKKDCIPRNVRNALHQSQYRNIDIMKLGFFPPPLIDLCPPLLSLENKVPNIPLLKNLTAFFIIKGTHVIQQPRADQISPASLPLADSIKS